MRILRGKRIVEWNLLVCAQTVTDINQVVQIADKQAVGNSVKLSAINKGIYESTIYISFGVCNFGLRLLFDRVSDMTATSTSVGHCCSPIIWLWGRNIAILYTRGHDISIDQFQMFVSMFNVVKECSAAYKQTKKKHKR